MYTRDYSGATRFFDRQYNTSSKKINLEKRRESNIKAIMKIIEEPINIDFDYSKRKRDIVSEISSMTTIEKITKNVVNGKVIKLKANVKLTDVDKDKMITDAFLKLDEEYEKVKQEIRNREKEKRLNIRKELLKQAKMLLILKDDEQIYDYYMQIIENPLPEEYKEIELEVYREFFMVHPYIENIIISYSELKLREGSKPQDSLKEAEESKKGNLQDSLKETEESVKQAEKSLSDEDLKKAIKIVSELSDSDKKEELHKRLQELSKKINQLKEEAQKAFNKAYETKTDEDIALATNIINKLGESDLKTSLLESLSNLVKSRNNNSKFITLLNNIIKNGEENNIIKKEELLELVEEYQKLNQDDAKKYQSEVFRLIDAYNYYQQDKKEKEYDEELGKYDKYDKTSVILELLSKPYTKLINSTFVKKIKKKKLERISKKLSVAEDSKKEKLQDSYNKTKAELSDYDIPSGVRLFIAKNKIIDLKPVLYKNKYEEISEDQKEAFEKAQTYYSNEMSEQLDEISKDLGSDELRVINVLDQYIELLSYTDQPIMAYNDALRVLNRYENILTKARYLAYKNQFDMIKKYRTVHDNNDNQYSNYIYEYDCSELDQATDYYDSETYENQKYKVPFIK